MAESNWKIEGLTDEQHNELMEVLRGEIPCNAQFGIGDNGSLIVWTQRGPNHPLKRVEISRDGEVVNG